jgi:hypothetical protein
MLDGGNGRYMINCRTYSVYSNGYWVYEVVTKTVGQYTGLTDRNGKKIFEGDIVKAPIYYDIGCYPHTETRVVTVNIPEIYEMSIDGEFEVIGNIHDNPELLEGEK